MNEAASQLHASTRSRRPVVPQRLLYDLSFTCMSGKTSGIERVVRSYLGAGQTVQPVAEEHAPEFVPVFASAGRFYRWDRAAQDILGRVAEFERDCLSAAPLPYRLAAKQLCRWLPHRPIRRWLLPPAGHLGIFKAWHRRWKKSALARASTGQSPIELNPTDLLWLPDAYWAQPGVWTAVERAREQGAFIAALVYDLIPMRAGQPNPGFCSYLSNLLTMTDVALCISNCEREKLIEFRNRSPLPPSACNDFRTVTLGYNFGTIDGNVRAAVEFPFAGQPGSPVYLCVNTFDPRKNHGYLLDAFESLWATGSQARLCLVGRVGWQCRDILDRIAAHPELNRRLFVFHDANDAEVDYCYRHARAVITASKDEGFGLPIVEALSRGRTTLASDIPIHREVGGDACSFFDPQRPENLANLVRQSELTRATEEPQRTGTLLGLKSWPESFEICWGQLLSAYQDGPCDRVPVAW